MQGELNNQTIAFNCPKHGHPLTYKNETLECREGCLFEAVNDIPRFVPRANYASSFGLQWNEYRATQLDSHTGLTISRDRLTRLLGGSLDVVKGKNVLEAGCGAGRFSEILLEAGARLQAVDLSTAVEANFANCRHFPHYSVCQASILELPFAPAQFDIVACIGVIQHTPNPEETIAALCRQVKPGGMLAIDHYTYGYDPTWSRAAIRSVMLKFPKKLSLWVCKVMANLLWPIHSLLWTARKFPPMTIVRSIFLKLSPLVDYHDAYPQLGPERLKIWAALDTHDTLTDYYKHLRSADEIRVCLQECGMERIDAYYAGNGVEARAYKPVEAVDI